MAHFFLASDALRLAVVFTPKCASQSLRRWCTAAIEAATKEPAESIDPFLVGPEKIAGYTDYWKVFFVRDPLLRLVGFYAHWVVRDDAEWCFADAQQRIPLRNKSFRQFLFALRHLYEHRRELQHHLVPQVRGVEGIAFDEIVAVERLSAGLAGLNRRLGLSVPIPHANSSPYDAAVSGPAVDRLPDWFREHGLPVPELFYDEEARAIALEIYAEDAAYYRKMTGLDLLRSEF